MMGQAQGTTTSTKTMPNDEPITAAGHNNNDDTNDNENEGNDGGRGTPRPSSPVDENFDVVLDVEQIRKDSIGDKGERQPLLISSTANTGFGLESDKTTTTTLTTTTGSYKTEEFVTTTALTNDRKNILILGRQQSFHRKATVRRRPSFRGAKGLSLAMKAAAASGTEDDERNQLLLYDMEPIDGILPLIQGKRPPKGVIAHSNRPEPTVKSIPAFAPYRRMARHRSYKLYWLNEFRHWWKSSRLLVRLGGMLVMTVDPLVWSQLTQPVCNFRKRKGRKRAAKLSKHLGQGGPMHWFLQICRPFTRTLRIIVAIWRWIEAAKPRRLEVGVEEAMAFMGNRCSRILAKWIVDYFTRWIMIPFVALLVEWKWLDKHNYHPEILLLILGLLRAISPFAASFQGSRFGRVVTRQFFINAKHKWLPIQRISQLNPNAADCQEPDEVSADASLLELSYQVATALAITDLDHGSSTDPLDNDHYPHMYRKRNHALGRIGFYNIGCGSGGYTVYELKRGLVSILLHVTPYGPSIADQLPRYIVLEREDSVDMRSAWSNFVTEFIFKGPNVIEGYCYQGAFFSPWQFACLKERYQNELLAYDIACQKMCGTSSISSSGTFLAKPPTDLPTLKAFLETGRSGRDRAKGRKRYKQLQCEVNHMAQHIRSMMDTKIRNVESSEDSACIAPKGVILYFEGLDCAGKSSTGGLVQQALEKAGYQVGMRQYNRPPTPEQRQHEWMWRFERPDIGMTVDDGTQHIIPPDGDPINKIKPPCSETGHHKHMALVWDRGPGGDFVYGTMASLPEEEKLAKYEEFKKFDAKCRKDGILFCKLFFVTNRDAIANTLGKRLAQKQICRDLHTWLDASIEYTNPSANKLSDGTIVPLLAPENDPMFRPGLAEIDLHIDPTDFVAFNQYHKNFNNFRDFVLNTDEPIKGYGTKHQSWTNPWIVVNTGKRHPARIGLLKAFDIQLKTFTVNTSAFPSVVNELSDFFGVGLSKRSMLQRGDTMEQKMDAKFQKTLSFKTCILLMILLFMIFYYCSNTYDIFSD